MTLSTRLFDERHLLWVVLEKIMKPISARKIAITAMFLALLAVFAFTPIGLMPIIPGVIDTAFVLILLVTVAIQVEGLWVGLVCSTAFGVFSFINSFIRPSLMAFAFQNPLISILPRIAIAFTTYFAMVGMKKLTKKSKAKYVRKHLPSLVSAIVAVVTNTALVLGLIILGYGNTMIGDGTQTITQLITGTILVINFPVEIIANVLFAPMLYSVLIKYAKRGK